jgi:hypothetical protein
MDAVEQICRPLKQIGIVGFFYQKTYSCGKIINFSSNSDWSRQFLLNLFLSKYPNKIITDYFYLKEGVSLSCLNEANVIWQEGKNYFGLGNVITIHEIRDTYIELVGFYSTSDNYNINSFYINNLDILEVIAQVVPLILIWPSPMIVIYETREGAGVFEKWLCNSWLIYSKPFLDCSLHVVTIEALRDTNSEP